MENTIKDRFLKFSETGRDVTRYNFYSALGYIPVLGWIIPLLLRKRSNLCKFHSRQAGILFVFFIVITGILYLFYNLPVLNDFLDMTGFNTYVTPALLYIAIIGYLFLCVTGAVRAYRGIQWYIPFIRKFIEYITEPVKIEETDIGRQQ